MPPSEVRAGDLIFPLDSFGEGGVPGPGHVQMAISGTQVVHAPHTGDVVRGGTDARSIRRRDDPCAPTWSEGFGHRKICARGAIVRDYA